MYIIGLTGNIATGKSTVARLLRDLGAEAIDADKVAHGTMAPGTEVWQGIRRAFGPQVIAPDGTVDRRALGAIVFADPAALARLEGIVHPAVRRALVSRLEELRRRRPPPEVVVIEAIKLFEGGLARLCAALWAQTSLCQCKCCCALWVVVAPRQVQIDRLVRTRQLTSEEALARIDAQPPVGPKLAQADVVIVNDGTHQDLRRKVLEAWERIPSRPDSDSPAKPCCSRLPE